MERPFLVDSLIGVSTKVVALSLQQVGWQSLHPVTVVIAQSRAEGGDRNAQDRCRSHDRAPRLLGTLDRFLKERMQQQVFEVRILVESFFDVVQELSADDATATPQQCGSCRNRVPNRAQPTRPAAARNLVRN